MTRAAATRSICGIIDRPTETPKNQILSSAFGATILRASANRSSKLQQTSSIYAAV